MTGFHWQDEALTRRDLDAACKEVLGQYRVDPARVIVGGFSSGGFASLLAAFHQFLPVRGFVALCPEVPTSITDSDVIAVGKRARNRDGDHVIPNRGPTLPTSRTFPRVNLLPASIVFR